MNERSALLRIGRGVLRWLDRIRRVLHFCLMVGLFLVLLAVLSPQAIIVPNSAALLLNPQGALVEQLSGDPFDRAIARAQGLEVDQSLLPDMIDAIRAAKEDSRIKAIVLQLEGMTSGGLSKLQELAAELEDFRTSGKPVYAVGASYDRNQYFIASHADEILMHPMGIVLVEGYETFIPYFRSAIEKLSIDYRVWAAGEYKSAVEPITRDDMSPEDREARSRYLSGMWRHYQDGVAAARELESNAMQRYADEFASLLRASAGDTAQLALDFGLVDNLLQFDEMDARIRAVVGSDNGDAGYTAIDFSSYIAAVRAEDFSIPASDKVAIIVAAGEILDGEQPSGTIGAESLNRLIREAREDGSVKALVLRVDSPGGSAFASELIRRELDLFRETERPVVVSMGSVAASGGYWISMSADEIWASETTLTGSIGAYAAIPTFPRTLERVGVTIDGVGTTRLSGQMSALRGIGDDIDAYVALSLQHTYDEFVGKVAMHRELDPAAVESSAQGRVWIGDDALARGLVDSLGGLDAAIESAASLAALEGKEYSIEYFEAEPGLAERIALELMRTAAPVLRSLHWSALVPDSVRALVRELESELPAAIRLDDPRGIYTHCLCDVR